MATLGLVSPLLHLPKVLDVRDNIRQISVAYQCNNNFGIIITMDIFEKLNQEENVCKIKLTNKLSEVELTKTILLPPCIHE